MPVDRIDDLADARLADYRHVPDPELLRHGAIFVAEGRLVVRTLLTSSSFRARSVLVTEAAYQSLADVIEPRLGELDAYLVAPGAIESLTGFAIHRGCLAIGERPPRRSVAALLDLLPGARRLVVLEQVANADNLGGIFRNAAALGADGIVLGPHCCDALYRKTIRVSTGAALRVPFAHAEAWPGDLATLRQRGFRVVALTPRCDATDLARHAASTAADDRTAILAGSEERGLSVEALAAADVRARIPMAAGIDSLNVATAVAIALHRLGT